MIKKITHVAVAVNSIEETSEVLSRLFDSEAEFEHIPAQGVKTAAFKVGNVYIELVEATEEESGVQRFIDKRGEGIHHICLEVDDIDSAMDEFRNKGFELLDETPRTGTGGRKIVFLHPKSTGGILFEVTESQ